MGDDPSLIHGRRSASTVLCASDSASGARSLVRCLRRRTLCRSVRDGAGAGLEAHTIVGAQYPPFHGEYGIDNLLLLRPGHGGCDSGSAPARNSGGAGAARRGGVYIVAQGKLERDTRVNGLGEACGRLSGLRERSVAEPASERGGRSSRAGTCGTVPHRQRGGNAPLHHQIANQYRRWLSPTASDV